MYEQNLFMKLITEPIINFTCGTHFHKKVPWTCLAWTLHFVTMKYLYFEAYKPVINHLGLYIYILTKMQPADLKILAYIHLNSSKQFCFSIWDINAVTACKLKRCLYEHDNIQQRYMVNQMPVLFPKDW